MAQHEHPSIIHLYLEVPMLGIEPAVQDFEHGEAALAKSESAWLLFAAISGVALDAYIYRGTSLARVSCMAINRFWDVPLPMQDVQGRWREVQGSRQARVRFAPIDESHTRVEKIKGDPRGVGLAGRRQAGYYLSFHAGGQGLALRGFLRNAVIWPAICLNSSSLP